MYCKVSGRLHTMLAVGLLVLTSATVALTPNSALARQSAASAHFTTLQVDTTPIQIFDKPSQKGKLLQTVSTDGRVAWDGTAQKAEGRQWLQVRTQDGTVGWTAPDSQVLYNVDPYAVTPAMTVGAAGEVAQTIPAYTDSALTTPAGSTSKDSALPAKTTFTVTAGPVTKGLYTAWQIKLAASTVWVPDIPGYLQIDAPLTVYSYQVCDGFDLKTFGVPGWDSVVKQFSTLIAKGEQVQCLASTNFKNDQTPVVMVLTHLESDTNRHDTLYLFAQANGVWATLYKETAEAYARTERIAMYNISPAKNPIVLWAIRNDGTGQYLRIEALQYTAAGGARPVMNVPDLYKGNFEIGSDSITLLQAILKDGEANCCASGFNRQVYQWQTDKFAKVLDDQPPAPYWLQGVPKQ